MASYHLGLCVQYVCLDHGVWVACACCDWIGCVALMCMVCLEPFAMNPLWALLVRVEVVHLCMHGIAGGGVV